MNAGDPPRQKELFPNPSKEGLPESPSGSSDFSVQQEGRGDNWSVVLVDKLVGAQSAHCIPSVNWAFPAKRATKKADPRTVRFSFRLPLLRALSFLTSFGG